jgi:uncharacterized membrane protein
MNPQSLSHDLRLESNEYLDRRRKVVVLSLTAIGSLGLITLYQMGLIKRLPEPALPYFDAEKVDAAPEAYALLAMPDGVLGIGSYAATLGLAAMGGAERITKQPWIPLALAVKVGFDTLQAIRLTWNQWTKQRAFCIWCLVTSIATFATLPLVIPEAREAVKHLRGKDA